MRKTKIICTLGPSTEIEGNLRRLIEEGMDIARFNFSHGSYEEHGKRLLNLRKESKEVGRFVATLLDTKGPEIRIKQFENGKVELKNNQLFILTTDEIIGNDKKVSVTYKDLVSEVSAGTCILIDDGLIELQVEEIEGNDIICRVINGGIVSNNKGVNLPSVNLKMPYMSEKDKNDIIWGIRNDYDFIAASFVRTADDVKLVRKILDDNGGKNVQIISKIENNQGIQNIDEIIEASDGIMIARGDMGVEIAGEEVPIIQKMIIKKACDAGKQVITATQMLDSMMKNPRPTRAETTDVANAIYDGTGAIMLSGETAAGLYPVESLKTMVKIATRTEEDIDYRKRFFNRDKKENKNITDAICHATCTTAYNLDAKTIISVTKSGSTARTVSKYRPKCGIVGCTTEEKVCRQLNLVWGVTPVLLKDESDVFDLFKHSVLISKEKGYLDKGDITVITSGVPLGISGKTNMIKVEIVD